jgi:hypothetical protein
VRTLRQKVQGMLCERTAISRRLEELAWQELEALQEEDRTTPDPVYRDPYLLDFLGLADNLQREGPGGGHFEGAGEVPAGAVYRLLFHRPAEAPS